MVRSVHMPDVIRLTELVPEWLETPALLTSDTHAKTGPYLFNKLAKEVRLDWPYRSVGIDIINLFQNSVDILAGICGHEYPVGKKAQLHKVFGDERAAVWSFGLAFRLQEMIRERMDEDLAFKTNQLVTRVLMLHLEGRYRDMDARFAKSYDYKKTALLTTAYSSIGFPVALLTLLRTGNLDTAIEMLENKELLELGYWFHAEADLVEHFDISKPKNTDLTDYTVFVNMLAQKVTPELNVFPTSKELLLEYLNGHDCFYDFIIDRENTIKPIEAELKKVTEAVPRDLVTHVKKLAVPYYRTQVQLNAYGLRLPDFRGLEYHPRTHLYMDRYYDWARSFPKDSIIYQFAFQFDFAEWISYSYPFIPSVETLYLIFVMNVLWVCMDDTFEQSVHMISDIERVFEDCSKPGFLEGKVEVRPFRWSDPDWPLLPSIELLLTEAMKCGKELQQPHNLGDFGLFKSSLRWVRAIRAIREMVFQEVMDYTVEEYNAIRTHESETILWANVGAAWRKQEYMWDFGYEYYTKYSFISFMQNELVSYGNDVIANNERPRSLRRKWILNSADNYRWLRYPDESIQDIFFRLNQEEKDILDYLRTFEGTNDYYMTVMFLGWQYHVLAERYSRSVFVSNKSAICIMF